MQARYSIPSQTWEPGSGHAPNAQSKFWTLHKLQLVLSESSRAFCEAHATGDLWKHLGRNHLDSLPSKKDCRAFLDSCQSNMVRLELRELTQVGEIFSRYNAQWIYVRSNSNYQTVSEAENGGYFNLYIIILKLLSLDFIGFM